MRWGLDERLLDIAENYISLPIHYLGVELKKEIPNGKSTGVRKWHLDTEDYRMVKIIVYLTDVDSESGPFEYLPRYKSSMVAASLQYKSGLIADDVLAKYVPNKDWHSCVGHRHTVMIIDPANILHRAKPALNRERRSITFHYISKHPIHNRTNGLSISKSLQHLYPNLSQRQLDCLVDA